MKTKAGLLTIIVCLLISAVSVSAATTSQSIQVFINGQVKPFNQPAVFRSGTALVPFRAVFESWGFTVGWDAQTQKVTGTKDDTVIELSIGERNISVNSESQTLPSAPVLLNGTTMVPSVLISQAAGYQVWLSPHSSDIYISTQNNQEISLTLQHTEINEGKEASFSRLAEAAEFAETVVPGLTVELKGLDYFNNYNQKIAVQMAAADLPEIFAVNANTIRKYADYGMFMDLTDILEELGIEDEFMNLKEFTVDGKIYGLPASGFLEGFFYNKEIFDGLGVEEPETWEEMNSIIAKAMEHNIIPFAMSSESGWIPMMTLNSLWVQYAGDNQQDLAAGKAKWNSSEMIEAFTHFENNVQAGYYSPESGSLDYESQLNQVVHGEAAMVFDGSWSIYRLVNPSSVGDEKDEIGFFPMPSVSGGKGSGLINAGYTQGYGFSKDVTLEQKAAIKILINEMFNETMQLRGLVEETIVPSMKIDNLNSAQIDPLLAKIVKVNLQSSGSFPPIDFVSDPEVTQTLYDGVQEMTAGRKSAVDVLNEVQKVQERLLKGNHLLD
jgi:raffinose/stachyose/melibiose transport system substrate-binding protein